ncbi:MAG: hypothetical protein HZB19_00690 [Chloroflexi bacterium]|nr:hypothetical protein [Chloroflexota bacterium]
MFRFVYLPASLPAILTALRQSIGTAVAVLYISELFATKYGLGMYFGVDWLERKWCRWKFVG